MEAVYCVTDSVMNVKKTMYSGGPQDLLRRGRQSCELNISIPLQCLLKTAQQQMDNRPFQLAQIRAVEHQARPINVQAALYLAKSHPLLLSAKSFRQPSYFYSAFWNCHGRDSWLSFRKYFRALQQPSKRPDFR
jgi:hypothetical protein